jgi:hypothetical protein
MPIAPFVSSCILNSGCLENCFVDGCVIDCQIRPAGLAAVVALEVLPQVMYHVRWTWCLSVCGS